MKKRTYISNIVMNNGLFEFRIFKDIILSKNFDIINYSTDDVHTIDDIIINITDETPDLVIMIVDASNINLYSTIIKELIKNDFKDIVVYYRKFKNTYLSIESTTIPVVTNLNFIIDNNFAELNKNETTTLDNLLNKDTYKECGQNYKNAMENGANMFISGFYDPELEYYGTKHVYLDSDVEDIDFNKFNDCLNINSALIQDNPKNNENFHKYFSHYHTIKENILKFDDGESGINFKIDNLSQINDDKKMDFYKIETSKDLDQLELIINNFQVNGTIDKSIVLANSCGFQKNTCVLSKLPRFRLDKNLDIYPCLYCDKSIGNLKEVHFNLLRSASRHSNTVKLSRKCDECIAKEYCGKCSMLANNISEEQYCNFMRNNKYVSEYLYISLIFGSVIYKSQLFLNSKDKCIQFSNSKKTLCYEFDSDVKRAYFIGFKLMKKYYLFGYSPTKIYEIDNRLMYVAEALARDISFDCLLDNYSKKFDIKVDTAKIHLAEASKKLKKFKVI